MTWVFLCIGAAFIPGLTQSGIFCPPFPKSNDAIRFFYFIIHFFREEVLAGRLPLWNPYLFGGTPFLANPQTSVFYPFNLLFLLPVSVDFTFKLNFLIHLEIAAYAMYRLCRSLGAQRQGAALGALAYGLNPAFILFMFSGWLYVIRVAAWCPAVLWAFSEAIKRENGLKIRRYTFLGAGFLFLQIIGGHPEWLYYTVLMLFFFCSASLWQSWRLKHFKKMSRIFLIFISMLLLAGILGAVQLIPTFEAAMHSHRGHMALTGHSSLKGFGYPPLYLSSLIIPKLFGPWNFHLSVDSLIHKLSHAQISMTESTLYCGLLTLLFSVICFKQKKGRFWMLLGLLGLAIALNDHFHLKTLMDHLFAPQAMFRNASRYIFISLVSLCILASLGATEVIHRQFQFRKTFSNNLMLVVFILLAAGILLFLMPSSIFQILNQWLAVDRMTLPSPIDKNPAFYGIEALRWAGTQLMFGSVLLFFSFLAIQSRHPLINKKSMRFAFFLIILFLDLMIFAWPYLNQLEHPEKYYGKDSAVLKSLSRTDPCRVFIENDQDFISGPNFPMLNHRSSVTGYDTFHLSNYELIHRYTQHQPDAYWPVLNVCAKILKRAAEDPLTQNAVAFYPDYLPRLYWTGKSFHTNHRDTILDQLPSLSTDRKVFLEELDSYSSDMRQSTPDHSEHATVEITRDLPGHIQAAVSSTAEGWVVFNEIHYPGWKVSVDDHSATLLRANGVMQGVKMPPGNHTVTFFYAPESLTRGLWVSLLGFFLIGILWFPGSIDKKGSELSNV